MKKILILLFIYYFNLFPQIYPDIIKGFAKDTSISVKINKNLPLIKMNINIHKQPQEVRNNLYGAFYTIKIFNFSNENLVQEIKDTLWYGRKNAMIKIIDINLDEYLDIAFVREVSVYGNLLYNFWIYNPESNLFFYNSAYSELCCEMRIDTSKKEIFMEYYNFMNMNSQQRYYKIYYDKPVLYELRETAKLNNVDSILIIEYGLENGELKKIKEYKVKDEPGWE